MNPIERLGEHNNQFTSETAREAAKKSNESKRLRKTEVDALLIEAGFDPPGDAPETLRQLALKAVKGSSADMRLFLQQSGQLVKAPGADWDGSGACPTCGLDPAGGLVLQTEDMEAISRCIELLGLEEGKDYEELPEVTL